MPQKAKHSRPYTSRRPCNKCGWPTLPHEFPLTRSSYKLKSGEVVRKRYRLSYCHHCLREQKDRAAHRLQERKGPRKRKLTPEQRCRNNALSSSKAARRRYRQTRKGKSTERRIKRRARAKTEAAIPVPVIKPLVERMVEEAGSQASLARATSVPVRRINGILHERSKGVSVGVCDLLAIYGDFTLIGLTERVEEWALLTGDTWPTGYKRWRGKVGIGSSVPDSRRR